jgi:hypothetical protein
MWPSVALSKSVAVSSVDFGREVFRLDSEGVGRGIAPKNFVTADQHGTGSREPFLRQQTAETKYVYR